MSRPNILYLHSHDTGRYIQPYGYPVDTPHLQQFAEQGVMFRQAFCVNPTCSASRACLLTGCYPHQNGMEGLAHRGWSLKDYHQHILHRLKDVGYHAALAGIQHIAHGEDPWKTIGYDETLGEDNKALAKDVRPFLQRDHDKPFFLSVGWFQTHRVFPPLDQSRYNPHYVRPPAPIPDTPQTRVDMARYLESARQLDEEMGSVLQALDETGLAENTLVIITTDHGVAYPDMKCNLTDHGTGVMLMMRGPGGFADGKVIDAMVSHMDVYPTICELLDLPKPDWLEGQSLLPLLREQTADLHEELFGEVNYHAAYEPMRSVRTKRWKYIRRFDGREKRVLPNCDDAESKDLWLDHGWADLPIASEQLYDLVMDPHERCNLVGTQRHAGILAEMRDRLNRFMESKDDPIRHGPLPAPQGARVNDPDGVSPNQTPRIVGDA